MNIRTPLATAATALALFGGLATTAQACPRNPSPRAATCAAVWTWAHHRTPANLARVARASRHASPTIRTDVAVVVTEVRQDDWYDLPDDLHSLYVDSCR